MNALVFIDVDQGKFISITITNLRYIPKPTSKLATRSKPVNLRNGLDIEAWCKITLAKWAESIA